MKEFCCFKFVTGKVAEKIGGYCAVNLEKVIRKDEGTSRGVQLVNK